MPLLFLQLINRIGLIYISLANLHFLIILIILAYTYTLINGMYITQKRKKRKKRKKKPTFIDDVKAEQRV